MTESQAAGRRRYTGDLLAVATYTGATVAGTKSTSRSRAVIGSKGLAAVAKDSK